MKNNIFILSVAFLLFSSGQNAISQNSIKEVNKTNQVSVNTFALKEFTGDKSFKLLLPKGTQMIRFSVEQTGKSNGYLNLYAYNGNILTVFDTNGTRLSQISLDNSKNVQISKNGKSILTRILDPKNNVFYFKVFDENGMLLFQPIRAGTPSISEDGQYLLIPAMEFSPMEKITIYDRNGNKIWSRGDNNISIVDAKFIQNDHVLIIERKKGEHKNILSVFDIEGNIQFEKNNIEPDIDYKAFSGGTLTIVTTTGAPYSIYFLDLNKKDMISTAEKTEFEIEDLSVTGQYYLFRNKDTLIYKKVGDKNEIWKLSNIHGQNFISPTGKWVINLERSKNDRDNKIVVLNKTGEIVYKLEIPKSFIQRIKFINDSLFYFQNDENLFFTSLYETAK